MKHQISTCQRVAQRQEGQEGQESFAGCLVRLHSHIHLGVSASIEASSKESSDGHASPRVRVRESPYMKFETAPPCATMSFQVINQSRHPRPLMPRVATTYHNRPFWLRSACARPTQPQSPFFTASTAPSCNSPPHLCSLGFSWISCRSEKSIRHSFDFFSFFFFFSFFPPRLPC
ncbi:hypothetical protein BDV59DRAFT_130053 [Aspergillus ambiguus]|uniref:uncharacterized protein n=1 Tax=Aspergillus ambiguus TaxID=176160 RepID=UPI003CCE1F63